MGAAKELKDKGAGRVYAFATHGIFSGNFYERLKNSCLEKVLITDSIKSKDQQLEESTGKITRVPMAKLLADKIYDLFQNE